MFHYYYHYYHRLGAVPFFFIEKAGKTIKGVCNALACGVMVGAAFDLIHEGQQYDGFITVVGLLLGVAFVYLTQQKFADAEDMKFSTLTGMDAKKAMMIVGIMAVHSIGEGAGVGVSFAGGRGRTKGPLITFAIAVHNIPEGLAIAIVLISRGVSTMKAMLWAVFTSVPQPLLAVPAFMFVDTFRSLMPVALGFAAGCMIYVVFAELIPDALEDISSQMMAIWTTIAAASLELLRMCIDTFADKGLAIFMKPGEDADELNDWILTKIYVLCIGGIAAVSSVLLVNIIKKRFDAVNVIKILIMVFAGSFGLATTQREFSMCASTYQHIKGVHRLTSTICGGLTAALVTRYLPIDEMGALPHLSNDELGSPTKRKKTLNTSMVVPMYTTASLASWAFALGLSTDAIGIRYQSQIPFDITKLTLASLFATLALSSHRSKFVATYVGGAIIVGAMFLGVYFHDFSLDGVQIVRKGSFLSVCLHAFSIGMQYVFMGAAIREIKMKRAFGHASLKYWTFVISTILAAMLCGILITLIQELFVTPGYNEYVMSFC